MAPKRKGTKDSSGAPAAAKGDAGAKKAKTGWAIHSNSVLYKLQDQPACSKVAAFDADNSLVFTHTANINPADADDWRLYNKQVPAVVQRLGKEGHRLVIFHNSGMIKSALKGKQATKEKARIDAIIERLGVPVSAYISAKMDEYHKPEIGMWTLFYEHCEGQEIDKAASFCVGSAAGSVPEYGVADKEFAAKIGIDFKTPEDVFGDMDAEAHDDPEHGGGSDSKNPELVNCFRTLSQLHKDDTRRRIAYFKIAQALEAYPEKIASGKQVASVPGVGKSTVSKIDEWLETGKMKAIEDFEHHSSPGPEGSGQEGSGAN